AWLRGETPNPCGLCNQHIKFGLLLQAARSKGYLLATGHYACLTKDHLFCPATDTAKEQNYFLSLVAPQALSHLVFPLATQTKADCRKLLKEVDLTPPEKKESQDICFLAETSLREFCLQQARVWGEKGPKKGPIYLLREGKEAKYMGEHEGLFLYTEGQRRGLGIPYTESLYVLAKDVDQNRLFVGTRQNLGIISCTATLQALFVPTKVWPKNLMVKIRYRQSPCLAQVTLKDALLEVVFAKPEFPTAKGQILQVMTPQGLILAGGIVQTQTLAAQNLDL
ncbi:MAG: tRNA-specific 2-thiouridylase, partial [Desulfovibrio sp.]|nr:tRNA-specific 2-thiouridylase [Desulfovibrio sp.]